MRPIRTTRRWLQRQLGLHRLRHHSDEAVRAIVSAIRKAQAAELAEREREWINRIEALRAVVNASTQSLNRIDFGAGDSELTRTSDTMQAGIEVECTLGALSKKVSKPPFWCQLLFQLVRELKPQRCLELGSAVGISAAYQGAALKLNERGVMTTLEGTSVRNQRRKPSRPSRSKVA